MGYDYDGSIMHLLPSYLKTAFVLSLVCGVAVAIIWGSSIDAHNATLCGTGPVSTSVCVTTASTSACVTTASTSVCVNDSLHQ